MKVMKNFDINYYSKNKDLNLGNLLKLNINEIKGKCGEWENYLFRNFIIDTKYFNELNAVGLLWGYELNKVNHNHNYNPFPLIDHRLYKVILCGNIVNDRYYDISINNYINNYEYPHDYNYTQIPQIQMISSIPIKIKSITIIPTETEQEAIDNFCYYRELYDIYQDEISPQLHEKILHGPENNLILDNSVREEILMLNKKSLERC